MWRACAAVVIGLTTAFAASSRAAADGLLLFDACGPTEPRPYEHPAFHAIRPDGSGFRPLRDWPIRRATAGCPRSQPSWSPSGRRIVYRHGNGIAMADRRLRPAEAASGRAVTGVVARRRSDRLHRSGLSRARRPASDDFCRRRAAACGGPRGDWSAAPDLTGRRRGLAVPHPPAHGAAGADGSGARRPHPRPWPCVGAGIRAGRRQDRLRACRCGVDDAPGRH